MELIQIYQIKIIQKISNKKMDQQLMVHTNDDQHRF